MTPKAPGDFALGSNVWEVAIFYDDGDDPIADSGESGYVLTLDEARRQATEWLSAHSDPGWYASIAEGRIVDEIGDSLPYDFTFEPGDHAKVFRP